MSGSFDPSGQLHARCAACGRPISDLRAALVRLTAVTPAEASWALLCDEDYDLSVSVPGIDPLASIEL